MLSHITNFFPLYLYLRWRFGSLGRDRHGVKELPAVEFALEIGCDPNGPTANILNALTEVAPEKKMEAASKLKSILGDRDLPNNFYMRPLHMMALVTGNQLWDPKYARKAGDALVKAGAKLNTCNGLGESPLSAVLHDYTRRMSSIDFGVSTMENSGLCNNIYESLRLVLELGVDPNIPNADPLPMQRPLDTVVAPFEHDTSVRIAELLLKFGCDFAPIPFSMVGRGRVQVGSEHVCHFAGGKLIVRDFRYQEYDYLKIAVECGNSQLIQFAIEKAGRDPDLCISGGGFPTLLSVAVVEGDKEIVQMLLDHGSERPRQAWRREPCVFCSRRSQEYVQGLRGKRSHSQDRGFDGQEEAREKVRAADRAVAASHEGDHQDAGGC